MDFFCQLGIDRNRIKVNVDHMLVTSWSHVGHFGISIWNLEALRKQSGSSQDGFWSVFSVQEQPQEVAEVLPAAAKKASKVQLRLCSCRASRIFASFPQSATIRPIYSAFMWFVEQAWLHFFKILIGAEGAQCEDGSTYSCRGMLWYATWCIIVQQIWPSLADQMINVITP